MKVRVLNDKHALACAAATQAAGTIRQAIAARGTARILAATGDAQSEFLEALSREPGVAWGEVELFHLGEFVGVRIDHPASLRKFLFDRLITPTRMGRYHPLAGEHDPERTCRDEGEQLRATSIDVAFAGIGESGNLAFNSAPADFATEKPYLVVRVDEGCRREQVDEGWFKTTVDVPDRAISISIRQLLKAKTILGIVPGARKAEAVKRCVEGAVSPLTPASILRTHPDVTLFLDPHSAALLKDKPAVEGM